MLSSYSLIGRCAAVAIVSVCSLPAATYYVDSINGNDGNNGTTLPWKTIARANKASFNPGDQLLLNRGDVWYETLVLHSSGSAGKPVTVSAYGTGSAPVLDEQGVRWPAVNVTGLSYVTIDSLAMQNASNVTVYVHNSSNVDVQNCTMKNSASHAVNVDGLSPNVVVNNNTYSMDSGFVMRGTFIFARSLVDSFTATNNTGYMNDNSTNNGIITLDINNVIIANNTIYSGTEAIGIKGLARPVTGGQIYGNAVYNTSGAHGDGESIELTGNSLSTQVQASVYHNFVIGGALLDNAIAGVYAVNSSVYNNIVVGRGFDAGVHFTSNSSNISVYGNTIYNMPYGVLVDSQSQATIMNNIIVGASYHPIAIGADGGQATEDYNIFYQSAASAGVSPGAHTQVANPMFVSSSPSTANDFHLQANSPAVGTGASLGSQYDMALDPTVSCFPCGTVSQDTLGPWSRGAFAFRIAQPNGPVSISPNSGSGLSTTFSSVFADSAGYGDIAGGNILVAPALSTQHACWIRYVGSNQSLYLQSDSGSSLLGPVKPGTSISVSNSQCTLNGLGSSVTGSANTLNVNANVTFAGGFTGTKTLYMYTQTKENVSSGWGSYGTWAP